MSDTHPAAKTIRGLNLDHVKCRSFGHAWDEWFPLNMRPTIGFLSACRCLRCGTERLTTLSVVGKVLNRHYHWPESYKEVSKMTRGEAQVWLHETLSERRKPSRRGRKAVAV